HRGAHLDDLDVLRADRLAGAEADHPPDAFDSGIVVLAGVLRQQLGGGERAVGPAPDDVGEGASAIDPELPAAHGALTAMRPPARPGRTVRKGCATCVPAMRAPRDRRPTPCAR